MRAWSRDAPQKKGVIAFYTSPFLLWPKGIPYPSQARLIPGLVQSDDVETHRATAVLRVTAEKCCGSSYDFSLLALIDRAGRRGIAILTTESDFSENQTVTVLHDEIDFTHPTTKISGYFRQALCGEVVARQYFRAPAYRSGIGSCHSLSACSSDGSPSSCNTISNSLISGNATGSPRWNCAQASRR